jgi:hypothetical protein
LKGFYMHRAALGVNAELGTALDRARLPSRADRRRRFLGHTTTTLPANPLAPHGPPRRHPKMLPDGAKDRLLETVRSARDRLAVTWLSHGGLRIGELCGLHLVDLHLRDDANCGQCRTPHLHVCYRPGNPNRTEAKTKHPWRVEDDTVTGGLIKRVSPAMIHTYFDYITTDTRAAAPITGCCWCSSTAIGRDSRGRRWRRGGCWPGPGSAPGLDWFARTRFGIRSPRRCSTPPAATR